MKHTTATVPPARPFWHRILSAAGLALVLAAGFTAARAADFNPPDRLTYQGYLADANGNPLATNNPVNYDVVFRIYSEQTGGTNVWAEKQTVTVDHGQFSVLLGEGSQYASEPRDPLNTVFASPTASDRYLELTVTLNGSPLTIAPRLRLVTSPYAFHARTATAVVSPNGAKLVTGANGALTVSGALNATSFAGTGAGVTAINAGNITTGILANARTTATEQNVANTIMMRNGIGDTVGGRVFSGNAGTGGIWVDGLRSQQFVGSVNTTQMGFYNGSAWRMVVDNGGRVGIGTESPADRLDVNGGVVAHGYRCRAGTGGVVQGHTFNFTWSGATMAAYIDNSFVGIVSGTSDRRLKEAIEPMAEGATARVLALKPASFKYRTIPDSIFKGDGQTKEGFIADELQQVVPSAVTGEKDALTSDGKIQPQVINLAPVVALLTKAMQEQQQHVAELEQKATRVEALERQVADLKELVNRLVVMREGGSSGANTTAANRVSAGQP